MMIFCHGHQSNNYHQKSPHDLNKVGLYNDDDEEDDDEVDNLPWARQHPWPWKPCFLLSCAKQPCAKPSIFINSYHQPWMTMMMTMMIMVTMMNMMIIMAMMILCKTIYIHHIISPTFDDLNFWSKTWSTSYYHHAVNKITMSFDDNQEDNDENYSTKLSSTSLIVIIIIMHIQNRNVSLMKITTWLNLFPKMKITT